MTPDKEERCRLRQAAKSMAASAAPLLLISKPVQRSTSRLPVTTARVLHLVTLPAPAPACAADDRQFDLQMNPINGTILNASNIEVEATRFLMQAQTARLTVRRRMSSTTDKPSRAIPSTSKPDFWQKIWACVSDKHHAWGGNYQSCGRFDPCKQLGFIDLSLRA